MMMIKKLIIMGILMVPFLFLTRVATAQNYNDLSPEIQAKMNQNKSEGKEILTDIYIHYEIQFGGVDSQERIVRLQELLANNSNALNFNYDQSNKHVTFVCPAKFDLKALKSFLKNDNIEINHLFKQEYSLEK